MPKTLSWVGRIAEEQMQRDRRNTRPLPTIIVYEVMKLGMARHISSQLRNVMVAAVGAGPAQMRRDTSNVLRPVANDLVEALELAPPTASDPGHWKSPDGFITMSSSLIKDGYTGPGCRFRALIAFDPKDAPQNAKAKIAREIPNYESMPVEQRRAAWSQVMQLTKQARVERVAEIIEGLDIDHDIEIPVHNIQVHRVSNTFFATVDLEVLQGLVALRKKGWDALRRINIENLAEF
jgi:hypothetical protein